MRKSLLAACLTILVLLTGGTIAEAQNGKKKLLLITESKGFRHGCVARKVQLLPGVDPAELGKDSGLRIQANKSKKGDKASYQVFYDGRVESPEPFEVKVGGKAVAKVTPCVVEKTFLELSKKTGMFDVVCSQDSRSEISAEKLKDLDGIFFYTTGTLPLSPVQQSEMLGFIRSGKGFAGSHCATDTFYGWKEYGEMIGGYFDGHPWHTKVRVLVEDGSHPATKHMPKAFEITDEIYQFRTPYTREKLRVLMRLDMDSVKNPGKRKDGDNALAWVRSYDKGRVFYTALGHRDEVWANPLFQQHVIGGLRFIFFLEDGNTTPSASARN